MIDTVERPFVMQILMAKKNCREEIDRINKKTNIKVACMKRELKFWQIVSIGTVVMGMSIGWML